LLTDHAKLVTFFSQCEEVIGRKKLQKMIYILKKCGYPFEERYQFHFYGPYSEELTLRVEELCNLGFLQETREKKSGYHQYRYELTGDGEEFLEHYNLELPPMTGLIEQMNGHSSRFLELVSTMMYFDTLPKDEMLEKVLTVKSSLNYTENEINEAWEFVQNIKH